MARKQNGLAMQNTIEPGISAPLDARQQVKLKSDLTDPASYPHSYIGMIVAVKEDANLYVLVGKDPKIEENWKKLVYDGESSGYDDINLSEYAKLVDIPDVSGFVKAENLASIATSGAYSDLIGVPEPYDDTQIRSDITQIQNDLTNYYLKDESYSKDEIDDIVSNINSLDIVAVTTLPTKDIRTDCIYLVKDSLVENNLYSEWIYIPGESENLGTWEKFGSASIDTSNLVTKEELSSALETYSTKVQMTDAISEALGDKVSYIWTWNASKKRIEISDGISDEVMTIDMPEIALLSDIMESEGIPKGGTTGQALVKKSDSDGDVEWANVGETSLENLREITAAEVAALFGGD